MTSENSSSERMDKSMRKLQRCWETADWKPNASMEKKRLAHIRGKMRKKVWINQGDIVLLSLRDFQDDKADVIVKYTADEARNLKAYGELPENAKINETDTFGEEDGECTFEFGDEGEVDIDDI